MIYIYARPNLPIIPQTKNPTNEILFIEESYVAHNILPPYIYIRWHRGGLSYDFFYAEHGLRKALKISYAYRCVPHFCVPI